MPTRSSKYTMRNACIYINSILAMQYCLELWSHIQFQNVIVAKTSKSSEIKT